MRRQLLVLLALVLVTSMLGACGSDDSPAVGDDAATTPTTEAAGRPSVDMKEYSFTMPTELEGGLLTVDVTNTGKESHAFLLARLDDGKTMADALAALSAEGEGPPPDFITDAGGTSVAPGATNTLSANFDKGTYMAYCPIPGPDGAPHFVKGMATQFTIGEGTPSDLEGEDFTIAAKDFTWTGLESLKAGEQTVKFVNEGPENHELAMAEMAPGKTVSDLLKFFNTEGPPAGPPPFVSFPGLALQMPKDGAQVVTLTLKANTTYAAVCFVANLKGPHFAQGMATDVKIKA